MSGYADAEPLLGDVEVNRIRERLFLKYPGLPDDTTLLTAVIEPPYKTPKGEVETRWPAFQFIVMAPHPRPLQRRMGINHAIVSTGMLAAWEDEQRERGHYVSGSSEDPAWRIFDATAERFLATYQSLQSIIN